MKQNPRHRSPVVDKASQLLDQLAAAPDGLSLAELVDQLALARSTVYRILNSLHAHGLVAKAEQSHLYQLGPRIAELARRSEPDSDHAFLGDVAEPIMEALSNRVGEACKLSVPDGDETLSIRVAQSPAEYGLTIRVGHRAPIQAGGSSKAIFAHWPEAEISRILSRPLPAFTPFTITDPDMLREVLAQIRQQGYAEDHSEITPGIRSVAAPIFGPRGTVVAALGIPYLGDPLPDRFRTLRQAVMEGARTIALSIGGGRAAPGKAAAKDIHAEL